MASLLLVLATPTLVWAGGSGGTAGSGGASGGAGGVGGGAGAAGQNTAGTAGQIRQERQGQQVRKIPAIRSQGRGHPMRFWRNLVVKRALGVAWQPSH